MLSLPFSNQDALPLLFQGQLYGFVAFAIYGTEVFSWALYIALAIIAVERFRAEFWRR